MKSNDVLKNISRLPLALKALKLKSYMKIPVSLRSLYRRQKLTLAFDTCNSYKRASVRTQRNAYWPLFLALIHDIQYVQMQNMVLSRLLLSSGIFNNYDPFPMHGCLQGGATKCIFIVYVPMILTALAQEELP